MIVALGVLLMPSALTTPSDSEGPLRLSAADEIRRSSAGEYRRSFADRTRRSLVYRAWQATTSIVDARSSGAFAMQHGERAYAAYPLPSPASDTLRNRVRGGDILIVSLPPELQGDVVERYSIVRAPALSWLVDRSFMWKTLPEDAGDHAVLIRADIDSLSSDTLVVSISVE